MKRILFLVLATLIFTSCNAKDALNASVSEPLRQEASSEVSEVTVSRVEEMEEQIESESALSETEFDGFRGAEQIPDPDYWLSGGAMYCEPNIDYQKDLTHPLIEAVPDLHPVALEFMRVEGSAFADKYKDLNELYKQGIQYKRKGQSRAHYDMLDTIRFGANCKAEVINGLRVGDSTAEMREVFGEPHFYNGELKLSGYRFPEFYLICVGESEITEISMTKYRRLPEEYQSIVSDYMSGKMPIRIGMPTEVAKLYPENIYDYSGGFLQALLYDNGIFFAMEASLSGYYFLAWNNYEGEIITSTPNTLQFMDEDMYFYFMSMFYRSEQFIFERSDGEYSPDGNIAAFPQNAGRPVEGDQIQIRWRDKSHCDITFWTRHAQSDLLWLSNRYLLFNVYFDEPAYFDTLQNKVYTLREAAGIVGERAFEVSYKKLDGNKLYLYDNTPYIISYSFDKDGNILFQAEETDLIVE